MRLGVIGTGTIASAIVRGLNSGTSFAGQIGVSPRNREIAAQLATEFTNVTVGRSNQVILDQSDVILLALRPQVAVDVVSALHFRADHRVISVVATLSYERLSELVAPATAVTKAIPLPAVAQRRGTTAIYPADTVVVELFDQLGTALPVDDESQYNALSASTAVVASCAVFAQAITSWLSMHGIKGLAARNYVTGLLASIVDAAGSSSESFEKIAESHTTKGGLNEQLRLFLEHKGLFKAVVDGLDGVLTRVNGQIEGRSILPVQRLP
ncbi:MAG TPA: pyrroline-5-carboxylate reductase [Bryobacteraceae bacterium]|nr:pyrroline-5-carboxylate reductase [Bryobacteraceae bacterium]